MPVAAPVVTDGDGEVVRPEPEREPGPLPEFRRGDFVKTPDGEGEVRLVCSDGTCGVLLLGKMKTKNYPNAVLTLIQGAKR